MVGRAYNALTLDLRRRFTKGLTFDANWTWSHSIDDASDPGTTLNETDLPQNVYNTDAGKGELQLRPSPARGGEFCVPDSSRLKSGATHK